MAYDLATLQRLYEDADAAYLSSLGGGAAELYNPNSTHIIDGKYIQPFEGGYSVRNQGTGSGDTFKAYLPNGTIEDRYINEWEPKFLDKVIAAFTKAFIGAGFAGAAGFGALAAGGGAGAAGGAAGWTSGYDLAGGASLPTGGGGLFGSGGILGTGFSTGSSVGDWLAKQGVTQVGKAGVMSLLDGNSPSRTGTGNNGGTSMGVLDDLFGTALTAGVLNNSGARVSDAYNTSATNVMNLANSLKDQGKFTPYNIRSGVGSVTTDANGNMVTQLDPKFQANSDLALDKSNYWLNQKANPLYAANEQKGLFGSGQMLDKAAAFDPEANAKIEYDLMQKLFAPTRESDNLDMENRLLQQGRLGLNYGSYGGSPELMALKQAQRMQDLSATKDSRQIAFDRQNNLISQAGALGDIGIKAGAAGTAQQKAYYDMANGLQQMSLRPQEMLAQQVGQSITAGANRSNAEQASARLFGNMGLESERLRSAGAFVDAGFKNSRDNAILQAVSGRGGAGGLLAGAGTTAANGIAGVAQKLLGMGIPQESLAQVMGDMGINMDQFLPEGSSWGEFDLSDLQFSDVTSNAADWVGAGDMDADWLSW
jgi:hypothetical protein